MRRDFYSFGYHRCWWVGWLLGGTVLASGQSGNIGFVLAPIQVRVVYTDEVPKSAHRFIADSEKTLASFVEQVFEALKRYSRSLSFRATVLLNGKQEEIADTAPLPANGLVDLGLCLVGEQESEVYTSEKTRVLVELELDLVEVKRMFNAGGKTVAGLRNKIEEAFEEVKSGKRVLKRLDTPLITVFAKPQKDPNKKLKDLPRLSEPESEKKWYLEVKVPITFEAPRARGADKGTIAPVKRAQAALPWYKKKGWWGLGAVCVLGVGAYLGPLQKKPKARKQLPLRKKLKEEKVEKAPAQQPHDRVVALSEKLKEEEKVEKTPEQQLHGWIVALRRALERWSRRIRSKFCNFAA